ncbi:hypothetical protein EON79_22150 [bacterium]|nr:MAG: hypothetical protein EON79_22150 [bacterium]
MSPLKAKIGAVLAIGAAVGTASAQDYIPGTNPMDIANTTSSLMNTHINNIVLDNMVGKKGGKGGGKRSSAASVSPMKIALMPASSLRGVKWVPAGTAQLSYRPDPKIREEAKRSFVARFSKINPEIGPQLTKVMKSFDMFADYRHVTSPEGYRHDNVADALSSTLVVAWLASKGKDMELSDAGQRIIRSRIATALLADPRMKSAAFRQRLGDEMQLTTSFLASGFGGAIKQGKTAEYGAAMASLFQGMTGTNPSRLALTSQGFVRI